MIRPPVPPGEEAATAKREGNLRAMLLIGAAWLALAAFDIWLILLRPDATVQARISFALGLVGVYTFGLGLLSSTGLLRQLGLGTDLTSPNPVLFLAGVFTVLALLQMALAVGLRSERTPESLDRRGGALLSVLQTPIMLLGALVVFPFVLVYLLLVAPLAWIAFAVVSAPLDSILGSAHDMSITVSDPRAGEAATITIKEFVRENLVTLRSLLVAVPALVSSLVLAAPKLI
jgi:hypothetical protein